MELCVAKQSPAIAKLSTHHRHPKHRSTQSLLPPCRDAAPLSSTLISHVRSGVFYSAKIRAAASDDTSSGPNEYVGGQDRDGPITLEAVPSAAKNAYNDDVTGESTQETPIAGPSQSSPQEKTSLNGQQQSLEFLENLNIKFDSEDSYSLLLYGSGALVALWLAAAIVGAIDSIPLFPKLLEVVGLGYTVWFSWRYLIFKKNREELAAKIDNLKQDVLGSKDD